MAFGKILAQFRAERARQINVEGHHPDGDDKYSEYELQSAARSYYYAARAAESYPALQARWPWAAARFKPFYPSTGFDHGPVDVAKCYVKAGGLIEAEIDRLKRLQLKIASDYNDHLAGEL